MTWADKMTVLDREDVRRCIDQIDPVQVVEEALAAHANGDTVLPTEGYLSWENSKGSYSRSLAMLGGLTASMPPLYGLKVVNAATSNPGLGIERAGGVIMLFDAETARPTLLAEAGLVSALRTASYTISSILRLGPVDVERVAVLGCGTLARMHLELFGRYLPVLRSVHLYDVVPERARALAAWAARNDALEAEVVVAADARSCVRQGQVLVTVTVSDTPYIDIGWFEEPTLVAHVSLDDIDSSVFLGADSVFVDDVGLVVDNPRRILGALVRDGVIAASADGGSPAIAGTLCQVIAGQTQGVQPTSGHVVSNPFGMAILDVALLGRVQRVAVEARAGYEMDMVGSE
jgi:ornithine cyclodeaminase